MVIPYRCFGTTYRFHLHGSNPRSLTAWPLRMGPIGCFETSVRNYHSTPRKIPKESRSHAHCGESLKSPTARTCSWKTNKKGPLLTRWPACVTWKPRLSRTIKGTTAWSWWRHTRLKRLHQCIPNARDSFWFQKITTDPHILAHVYSVRIVGNQNLKVIS
jgi:hypothetical protein